MGEEYEFSSQCAGLRVSLNMSCGVHLLLKGYFWASEEKAGLEKTELTSENAWLTALEERLFIRRREEEERRRSRQTDSEVGAQTFQRLGGKCQRRVSKVELCTEIIYFHEIQKKNLWKASLSRM